MSSGLKIGWSQAQPWVTDILRSSATATALPATAPGAAANTGLLGLLGIGSNTAPPPASVATTPPTTALGAAPGAPTSTSGLSKVASGIWGVDKTILSGTVGAAKSVVGGAVGVAKGVVGVATGAVHSILSIF